MPMVPELLVSGTMAGALKQGIQMTLSLVVSCDLLQLPVMTMTIFSRLEEELVEMMVSGTEAMKMSDNCHLKIDSA